MQQRTAVSLEPNKLNQSAFVLRIAPGYTDLVKEALAANQIMIGWPQATGLINELLSWDEFREIIHQAYYADKQSLRSAGAAAGHLWRFIREMQAGDLVVVPHYDGFYVAEIAGATIYREDKAIEDTAYRRNVIWKNDKKPIPRSMAKSALISRMKTQGTCTHASDLLETINECVVLAEKGEKPSFQVDLQNRLIRETLAELRNGRMESYGFEKLINTVLLDLGAKESKIIARSQDKGADIVATFLVAGGFPQILAVQAKHWQPEPPVGKDVVRQLIQGIEAEEANLGMVITSGSIGEDAKVEAQGYYDEKGIRIELVDGEQFAKLIVENGIRQRS